jgi:hypothetical protein
MMPKNDSLYSLVRKEAEQLLLYATSDELKNLESEILARIQICDSAIDKEFMESILHRIPDLLNGQGILPVRNPHNSSHAITSMYTSIEERLLAQEMSKSLEEGEEILKSEGREFVHPEKSRYGSNVDFPARFPKFVNKVKWGVVWNKYAQTHYDVNDNPPPRQILGYKFNIFYPDLKDKSHSPRYKLENSDDPDHLLLRFIAGPPYEDLAFKIPNKEWDLDKRHFLCQFDQGTLQLHFHFKRDRYKR